MQDNFLPPSEMQDWDQLDTEFQNASNPFHSIPKKKLDSAIQDIIKHYSENGVLTVNGSKLVDAVNRYYDANIPVDYWFRDMHKFYGSHVLSDKYKEITKDISEAYKKGSRVCFAGSFGVGKTFVSSCILKRIVETGKFNAMYVNMTDIVNVLTSITEKQAARKLLISVDFLVIDEFDQRFIGTENAADLFGRLLEPTLRARIQNRLPIILCTNSPNVVNSFSGALQGSIRSLMKVVDIVPILDFSDYRDNVEAQ